MSNVLLLHVVHSKCFKYMPGTCTHPCYRPFRYIEKHSSWKLTWRVNQMYFSWMNLSFLTLQSTMRLIMHIDAGHQKCQWHGDHLSGITSDGHMMSAKAQLCVTLLPNLCRFVPWLNEECSTSWTNQSQFYRYGTIYVRYANTNTDTYNNTINPISSVWSSC